MRACLIDVRGYGLRTSVSNKQQTFCREESYLVCTVEGLILGEIESFGKRIV